jgi:hypothetical protein
VCSTASLNIDRVPAVGILVDFARIFTILKCFCCWAVVLLMSFLSVFRALRYSPHSPARYSLYYSVFRLLVLLQIRLRNIHKSPCTFAGERLDSIRAWKDTLAVPVIPLSTHLAVAHLVREALGACWRWSPR